jgi:hypothetical protein
MFDSLRRWAHGQLAGGEVPVEATVAAMDAAGVRMGMLCAWRGPQGLLIPNDAVAAMVRSYPDRFAGVAAVDLARRCTLCVSSGAASATWASGPCGWCRGCGTCRPATVATTRCTPNASSWESRSAFRSEA